MACIIRVNGTKEVVTPENGTDFTLEEMYKHTKSKLIQLIDLGQNGYCVVDEEGKLRGRPLNIVADTIVHGEFRGGLLSINDPVVGDALFISNTQIT